MAVPGWNLHELNGTLAGHWSVPVNGKWRMTFRFEGENAILVDYQDYHQGKTEEHDAYAHPIQGIIKEALDAVPMSVTAFAKHIGVSRVALSRVLNEQAAVTPEMSIRISQAFGQQQDDIWFKVQSDYDFWQALQKKRKKISPLPAREADSKAV